MSRGPPGVGVGMLRLLTFRDVAFSTVCWREGKGGEVKGRESALQYICREGRAPGCFKGVTTACLAAPNFNYLTIGALRERRAGLAV